VAYTWDKQPASYTTQAGGVNTVFVPGASTATAAFGAQTRQIRVANGATIAWVKIDDGSPVATASTSMLIPANVVEYFMVNPGQKAAVFGTGGNLSITECS
jgi:hypothetical protein